MELIKADEKNAGKPANIIEKIAEGKLKTWMAESTLTEQPMANAAKYPNTAVGQALTKAGLSVVKFIRYKVGSA
jgi:elongation factor Ts